MELSKNPSGIHIIDSNGYCKRCKRFEGNEIIAKKYKKIGHISKDTELVPVKQKLDKNRIATSFLKYKKIECLDISKGQKTSCLFCETLYYLPLWILIIIVSIFVAQLAATGYLAYEYAKLGQYSTYMDTCNSKPLGCDPDKGLFCQTANSSQDLCNCPGLSDVNKCDCPLSYYWNGLKCEKVYSYTEGPCSGNYSCVAGLYCNHELKCKCPDSKPTWDTKSLSCLYKYLGCYNMSSETAEFDINGGMIQSSNSVIEIDYCIILCNASNKKYVIIFNIGHNRCICADTYGTYAEPVANLYCLEPCSIIALAGENFCPTTSMIYSVLQIGA